MPLHYKSFFTLKIKMNRLTLVGVSKKIQLNRLVRFLFTINEERSMKCYIKVGKFKNWNIRFIRPIY